MIPLDTELRWGYTLADIDHAARRGVYLAGVPGNPEEWYKHAHQEILIHLYTTDQAPTPWYLIDVGRDAIWAEQRDHRRHHGYADRDYANGPGSAPMFCKYWAHSPAGSAEEHATDRIAVSQIMPMLSGPLRTAVTELAVWDDYALAARALGVTEKGFGSQVSKARKHFLKWWHEGETPSKGWRRDRRVWSRDTDPAPRSSWYQKKQETAA